MANGLKRVQYESDFVRSKVEDIVYYAELDEKVGYFYRISAKVILTNGQVKRVSMPLILSNGITSNMAEEGGSEAIVGDDVIEETAIASIELPENKDDVYFVAGVEGFAGWSNITYVKLPMDIEEIGQHYFFECSKLESVVIPNSVTYIGTEAFGMCSSLTSISIPDSVTEIDNSSFEGCDNLVINYSGSASGFPWGATNATLNPS